MPSLKRDKIAPFLSIGGFQPFTLSDYPGCVASIIFTQGCNFKCPFCHNGDLIQSQRTKNHFGTYSLVMERLNKKRGKIKGIVISGGEPTLQPGLEEFLRQIKEMGYKVKLDTNGSRPGILKDLLQKKLVDFVAMDIKAPLHKYSLLSGVVVDVSAISTSIEIIAHSGIKHLFRTTFVEQLLDEEDLDVIADELVPAGSKYVVQKFISQNAFDPSLRTIPSQFGTPERGHSAM